MANFQIPPATSPLNLAPGDTLSAAANRVDTLRVKNPGQQAGAYSLKIGAGPTSNFTINGGVTVTVDIDDATFLLVNTGNVPLQASWS